MRQLFLIWEKISLLVHFKFRNIVYKKQKRKMHYQRLTGIFVQKQMNLCTLEHLNKKKI